MTVNQKTTSVHRIAWELHHGKRIPAGLVICHYCHNRTCCNPMHLHVGTYLDNSQDMLRDGRQPRGEAIRCSKLHEVDIPDIFTLHAKGVSQGQIARLYHVDNKAIQLILKRKTWKHVHIT